MAATKKRRFTTRQFCEAWAANSKAKSWDDFVVAMRSASGDDDYSEATIANRLVAIKADLKGTGMKTPKYPKKRKPNAVGVAAKLGW